MGQAAARGTPEERREAAIKKLLARKENLSDAVSPDALAQWEQSLSHNQKIQLHNVKVLKEALKTIIIPIEM